MNVTRGTGRVQEGAAARPVDLSMCLRKEEGEEVCQVFFQRLLGAVEVNGCGRQRPPPASLTGGMSRLSSTV